VVLFQGITTFVGFWSTERKLSFQSTPPGFGPTRPPGVSAVTQPRGSPAPVPAPPPPGPSHTPAPTCRGRPGAARSEARARDGPATGRPRRGECLRGAGARAVSPLLRRGRAGASPCWGRAGGGGRAEPRCAARYDRHRVGENGLSRNVLSGGLCRLEHGGVKPRFGPFSLFGKAHDTRLTWGSNGSVEEKE